MYILYVTLIGSGISFPHNRIELSVVYHLNIVTNFSYFIVNVRNSINFRTFIAFTFVYAYAARTKNEYVGLPSSRFVGHGKFL